MKISVEISYYPLVEAYKVPIKSFITSLQATGKLSVRTNSMSTHVFGEYDEVMAGITACIKEAFELPSSIFTLKIMNLDREK